MNMKSVHLLCYLQSADLMYHIIPTIPATTNPTATTPSTRQAGRGEPTWNTVSATSARTSMVRRLGWR